RAFSGGHMGDITTLAWSPNGALLATSASDRKILLWDTKTQKIVARYDYTGVINFAWHPHENICSFVTSEGELFIYPSFLSSENAQQLQKPLQPAPFIHDPLSKTSGNARKTLINGLKRPSNASARREGTPDSLDDILGPESAGEEDDFVEDDDGAGYLDEGNGYGKRSLDQAQILKGERPINPGLLEYINHFNQEAHHGEAIGVTYLTQLDEHGTLFSCPPTAENPAMVFYRPHETWTSRADWRTKLPAGEDVTGELRQALFCSASADISLPQATSLSDSYVVVTTSTNYVRVFTLFGLPVKVYRQKSSPTVTCTSWRDYVLTMGNGPVAGDGSTSLLYTIDNVKRDEICQSEDVVALPHNTQVKSVFFSDQGDPCLYDSTGVLLILQHWRTPGQARWVPLLDTKLLERLAGGRKEETYWPVAVAQDRFHCIILKGGDQYPYFPKPLLSEFEFRIPCTTAPTEDPSNPAISEGAKLEESFVRSSLMLSLLEDLVQATNASHSQKTELSRREVDVDKLLLQLLNVECREGEERGMKALEVVSLMKDRSGKLLEAAGKVAGRYGRTVLQDKINELAETRLMGMDED
ncbi:MAG: hypothetical protein Q9204_006709, partial [Flavoplaca sp. TL-2023a]